jgi:hypothetical protein
VTYAVPAATGSWINAILSEFISLVAVGSFVAAILVWASVIVGA